MADPLLLFVFLIGFLIVSCLFSAVTAIIQFVIGDATVLSLQFVVHFLFPFSVFFLLVFFLLTLSIILLHIVVEIWVNELFVVRQVELCAIIDFKGNTAYCLGTHRYTHFLHTQRSIFCNRDVDYQTRIAFYVNPIYSHAGSKVNR